MAEITLLKHGPIGRIKLSRPEVLNAMGRDWPVEMQAAINEVSHDPGIRIVLVTGEGRSFCSGVDLTQLAAGEIQLPWFHDNEPVFRAIETLDKPVIAVPTSIGYGSSFGGVTALLGMLNSCASNVAVVNIDNGFGAGYVAALINGLAVKDSGLSKTKEVDKG